MVFSHHNALSSTPPKWLPAAQADDGVADSQQPAAQTPGGIALVQCGVHEGSALPTGSKSPFKAENAEDGTRQDVLALDAPAAHHRCGSAAAAHGADAQVATPGHGVQTLRISDDQSVLDDPRSPAIGAEKAMPGGVPSRDSGVPSRDSSVDITGNYATLDTPDVAKAVSETPKRIARVLYDWTGGEDGDLNLVRGAVVTITDDLPGFGWLSGTVDGEDGIFPWCFVSSRVS